MTKKQTCYHTKLVKITAIVTVTDVLCCFNYKYGWVGGHAWPCCDSNSITVQSKLQVLFLLAFYNSLYIASNSRMTIKLHSGCMLQLPTTACTLHGHTTEFWCNSGILMYMQIHVWNLAVCYHVQKAVKEDLVQTLTAQRQGSFLEWKSLVVAL